MEQQAWRLISRCPASSRRYGTDDIDTWTRNQRSPGRQATSIDDVVPPPNLTSHFSSLRNRKFFLLKIQYRVLARHLRNWNRTSAVIVELRKILSLK